MSTATWLPKFLETVDPKSLTRFRADPSKVRVSVRPTPNGYRATVASRTSGSQFWVTNRDPELAVSHAIEAADACNMPGIDLGMEWAYPHPMGASAVKDKSWES